MDFTNTAYDNQFSLWWYHVTVTKTRVVEEKEEEEEEEGGREKGGCLLVLDDSLALHFEVQLISNHSQLPHDQL